ncbi:AbrB family transcriptional regulator [Photobacterium makurazakiensis]|uniref:AbrB family transcriptional regulator n=1 Tax=Photobacterium makurazakiensis TaxID=2910234 RepID=UPI003D111719
MLLTFSYMILGAMLGAQTNLPMGEMFGAMIAVIGASKLHKEMHLPSSVLTVIQLILGIGVGALINVQTFHETLPPSLLIGLLICLSLQMLFGYVWLNKMAGWSKDESMLGSFPGAMGAVLAIADSQKSPSQRVVFTHTVRLVALMLLASVIAMKGGDTSSSLVHIPTIIVPNYHAILWVFLISYVLGFILGKWGMPAPFMVTSVVSTAVFRFAFPDVNVELPEFTGLLAMVLLGGLVAVRVQFVTFREVLRYIWAGIAVMLIGLSVTLVVAGIFSSLLNISFLVLVMSWVPGSIEAMTATALLLGIEPAFVMISHVVRLLLLHLFPVFMMLKSKISLMK